jgi:hypothetical protein
VPAVLRHSSTPPMIRPGAWICRGNSGFAGGAHPPPPFLRSSRVPPTLTPTCRSWYLRRSRSGRDHGRRAGQPPTRRQRPVPPNAKAAITGVSERPSSKEAGVSLLPGLPTSFARSATRETSTTRPRRRPARAIRVDRQRARQVSRTTESMGKIPTLEPGTAQWWQDREGCPARHQDPRRYAGALVRGRRINSARAVLRVRPAARLEARIGDMPGGDEDYPPRLQYGPGS